ncbi:glycosyltransferase family 2 protein [Vibrio hepatarius]|uniref:glycosyltransferase family 2 protein n=1 Tax=Vibrio hepatarius TaxID=171383 RepID=UPI00142E544C|nr:glycosyltransferase family 2 protein [Vibrio hepatarius]NIY83311.1 glycosyltransferase family 2 protein [Vibrio hepatarius]
MEHAEVVVVIPAYNEEKTIGRVVTELREQFQDKIGIIVVSDASTDNTVSIATSSGCTVIELPENHGYAGALSIGMTAAFNRMSAKYVVTMDADGQHPVTSVHEVISMLSSKGEPQIDLIVGIRPYFARFSERIYSMYFSLFYNVKDPLCGLKAYSARLYHKLGTMETYDSIGTQMVIVAKKNRMNVFQVNILLNEREDEPRFGGRLKANWRILTSLARAINYSIFG